MRLNPEADAEALAHAGVLLPLATQGLTEAQLVTPSPLVIATQPAPATAGSLVPFAPQALTKAEAESVTTSVPVTTSIPVTAKETEPAQAGIHIVRDPSEGTGRTPTCDPVIATEAAPTPEADLEFPPPLAATVSGTQVTSSTCPPTTACLVAETAPVALMQRSQAHSRAAALAGNRLEVINADQHQLTDNEASGLSALQPSCANTKQTERGLGDRAVESGRAIELPSVATKEGMSDTMAAEAAKQDAGFSRTSGADRQTKRQKVAVPEADWTFGQHVSDGTAEIDHDKPDGLVQRHHGKPLEGSIPGALSLSPKLMTKDGSPSTAAHNRLSVPSTRGKVPMHQLSEPDTWT